MALPEDADNWAPPEGHEKISNATLGFLTIKKDGALHWKGEQVVVQQETKLVFGLFSGVTAVLVALTSIAIGVVTINSEYCFVNYGKSCVSATTKELKLNCQGSLIQSSNISFNCSGSQ